MAPKQKITRKQLLEIAFDITRKEGFSAVTARSVAKACTSRWVLNLARKESNLFHLLYLSDSFQGDNLWNVMMGYESNSKMAAVFRESYGLEEEECKDIFLRGYLLLHGIATMIATNHMNFTDDEAAEMVKRTVEDMVAGAGRRAASGGES